VIVLDENIVESQRAQHHSWRIHICQIGQDVGREGMDDDEIIPLLRTLRRPTFASRDRDFFEKALCSDRYCLVCLDVRPLEVADYMRRLLRHPEFKTWAQRKGRVVRVSPTGILSWCPGARRLRRFRWLE